VTVDNEGQVRPEIGWRVEATTSTVLATRSKVNHASLRERSRVFFYTFEPCHCTRLHFLWSQISTTSVKSKIPLRIFSDPRPRQVFQSWRKNQPWLEIVHLHFGMKDPLKSSDFFVNEKVICPLYTAPDILPTDEMCRIKRKG
jgi:hypothetical protein